MMWFIIILLLAAAGVSITLLILTRIEIKSLTGKLRQINNIKTNSKLTLSAPDRRIAGLAKEINALIDQKQQTEAKYKKMDLELRQAIANISHDLRTPLTSIIGYVQLMRDESLPPKDRDNYGDIVLRRAKSLSMLVSEFFDLSRLEADEYGFELQPLNLPDILCELIASFYSDFTNKGIEPEISIDETVPQIIADDTAVRRIYINLIQNALKYSTKFIALSLKLEGSFIISVFTNDAPNLTEEDAGHLFERFFTADRTRNGRSTGLGLAITKELVEKMGGSISSELAGGSLSIIIKWRVYNV